MSKRDDALVDESNDSPLQRRLRNLWHDSFDEQAFIEEAEALVKSDRTALLDQLVREMPKEKQQDYVKKTTPNTTTTDESKCRFYRHGGYDFAIREVTALLEKMKGE